MTDHNLGVHMPKEMIDAMNALTDEQIAKFNEDMPLYTNGLRMNVVMQQGTITSDQLNNCRAVIYGAGLCAHSMGNEGVSGGFAAVALASLQNPLILLYPVLLQRSESGAVVVTSQAPDLGAAIEHGDAAVIHLDEDGEPDLGDMGQAAAMMAKIGIGSGKLH